MTELSTIQKDFDPTLHDRGEDMLREYLQYEILKIVFEGKYAHRYTFLGGTCLRIAYQTARFSEDLDFDNVGLTKAEFEETAQEIKNGLENLGYDVEISFTYKGAFHCKIRFPAILYKYTLSPHKEARIFIKMDTEKQGYEYERKLLPINKFGVQTDILAVPLSLLGSQKIAAIMGRKRPKGRDFFDLHYILNRTKLDYGYLKDRFDVTSPEALRAMVNERMADFDFDYLAESVWPFLFDRDDAAIVRNFPAYWQTVPL